MILPVIGGKNHVLLVAGEKLFYAGNSSFKTGLYVPFFFFPAFSNNIKRKSEKGNSEAYSKNCYSCITE